MHAQIHERTTVTVEEAARLLGIGRSLAYELARRGELPGVLRLGRVYRVSIPALEKTLGLDRAATQPTTGASETEAA